jgi:hypothetical protein
MGLVFGVHFIPEGLAFGIKNTGNVVSLEFRPSSAHHIDHAIDCPSGLPSPISEVWHGMEGAVEVARAVY